MSLIYPMSVMVFYICGLGLYNFVTRRKAVRSGTVKLGYFRVHDSSKYDPPEYIIRIGRHYDNQFELPMLYLITCIVCLHLQIQSIVLMAAACLFILTRFLHTYIHLGTNHVLHRALAFMAGWACVITMWVTILVINSESDPIFF